jgi:hypothetical protein
VFDSDERLEIAQQLGLRPEGNAVAQPTLLGEYDSVVEYSVLDVKRGPEARKICHRVRQMPAQRRHRRL